MFFLICFLGTAQKLCTFKWQLLYQIFATCLSTRHAQLTPSYLLLTHDATPHNTACLPHMPVSTSAKSPIGNQKRPKSEQWKPLWTSPLCHYPQPPHSHFSILQHLPLYAPYPAPGQSMPQYPKWLWCPLPRSPPHIIILPTGTSVLKFKAKQAISMFKDFLAEEKRWRLYSVHDLCPWLGNPHLLTPYPAREVSTKI